MDLTRYQFSTAIGAFFEMATPDARRILPGHARHSTRMATTGSARMARRAGT